MKNHSLISILLLLCLLARCHVSGLSASEVCGSSSWRVYKDEKCVKLIDQLVSHDEAVRLCSQEIGAPPDSELSLNSLITIKSKEEQEAINQLIFHDSQVVDNVWLGAVRSEVNAAEFQWSDGESIQFNNWMEGSPSSEVDKNCSVITSGLYSHPNFDRMEVKGHVKSTNGLWVDASCAKRNLVVCQKPQTWGILQLQTTIVALRKELGALQQSHTSLQNSFAISQKNPVPIGFLYLQIPGHPEPQAIWSQVTWTDVSSSHAGNFFRVVGGASESFGSTQAASAGGLRGIKSSYNHWADGIWIDRQSLVTTKEPAYPTWNTGKIFTGTWAGSIDDVHLDFIMSSEEPRPVNQAVRIWKRTA